MGCLIGIILAFAALAFLPWSDGPAMSLILFLLLFLILGLGGRQQ